VTPVERGRAVFERAVGGLACADCHGESANPRPNADWLPSGHPLSGVSRRETLWGGRFEGDDRLLHASLHCSARFQYRLLVELAKGEKLDPADVPMPDEERRDLTTYLSTFEGAGDAVAIRRDADVDPVFDLEGDYDRGKQVWMAACALCHGNDAEGTLGPSLSGSDAVDSFTFTEYVRTGSLGAGWMPWFRKDRLSDQDLADLAARFAE